MAESETSGTDWTRLEIDLIVADYFDMLREELAGRGVNKSQHNKALQQHVRRSHGSIEFKHQNISAVLARLGYPWILGYKPRANFQGALIEGIERYLESGGVAKADFLDDAPSVLPNDAILFEDAPAFEPLDAKVEAPLRRLIRKFDPAARDARNRSLGKRGEERVFKGEVESLMAAGRKDLAMKVVWTSQEVGDGAGFDISSFRPDGQERLIEVKTTLGHKTTPFFLTENERLVSEERADAYRIVRLYDFARKPRGFELTPPWDHQLTLKPSVYRASFQ